jgi:hypothetical protein
MIGQLDNRDLDRDGKIEGLGLTVGEVRAVARRQFAGSIVAGSLVVAVAAVIGLSSVPYSPANYTTARAGAQQPIFIAPSDHVVASIKRKIEAP